MLSNYLSFSMSTTWSNGFNKVQTDFLFMKTKYKKFIFLKNMTYWKYNGFQVFSAVNLEYIIWGV